MKIITFLFAIGLGLLANANAADAPKPLLQLSAKKQVLDTDHDTRGAARRSKEKTVALRVVIFNTGSTTVGESLLAGVALVSRSGEFRDQVVKESLGEIKVPALKPNAKITLDLGKIQLSELEWAKRKFEEELVEWQVTCSQGLVEIGKAESSDRYPLLAKGAVSSDALRPGRANPGAKRFPRR